MENRLPAENLVSTAQRCLYQVIVETGAISGELQANNQELEAIIEGLLSVRHDLRAVFSDNSFSSLEKPSTHTAGNQDGDMDGRLDFPGHTEWIVEKSQAAINTQYGCGRNRRKSERRCCTLLTATWRRL
jgi:hypothetical protein